MVALYQYVLMYYCMYQVINRRYILVYYIADADTRKRDDSIIVIGHAMTIARSRDRENEETGSRPNTHTIHE